MTMPFVYKILSSEELNCFAFVSSLNPLYPRECKHAYPPFTDNWGTGTFRWWQIYVYIKVYQTMIISSFVNFFFLIYMAFKGNLFLFCCAYINLLIAGDQWKLFMNTKAGKICCAIFYSILGRLIYKVN